MFNKGNFTGLYRRAFPGAKRVIFWWKVETQGENKKKLKKTLYIEKFKCCLFKSMATTSEPLMLPNKKLS